MPQVVCVVCQSTDFAVKLGFYICSDCGTQSQDALADQEEEFTGPKTKHFSKLYI